MERRHEGFNLAEFLLGIVYIMTALFAFRDPLSSLASIVVVYAVFAIFKGIIHIFLRRTAKQYFGIRSNALLVTGVIDIIIGIFLFFNIEGAIIALPFVFAAWFIIDSAQELFLLFRATLIPTRYRVLMSILSILGIAIGIMLIYNPIVSALTITFMMGTYFLFSGINLLIYSF